MRREKVPFKGSSRQVVFSRDQTWLPLPSVGEIDSSGVYAITDTAEVDFYHESPLASGTDVRAQRQSQASPVGTQQRPSENEPRKSKQHASEPEPGPTQTSHSALATGSLPTRSPAQAVSFLRSPHAGNVISPRSGLGQPKAFNTKREVDFLRHFIVHVSPFVSRFKEVLVACLVSD